MRIRVTKPDMIYGKNGALSVGAEMNVKSIPAGWASYVETVTGDPKPEAKAVTNDDDDIDALRAEYSDLTGNDGDKRWKADTLRDKIAEAKAD